MACYGLLAPCPLLACKMWLIPKALPWPCSLTAVSVLSQEAHKGLIYFERGGGRENPKEAVCCQCCQPHMGLEPTNHELMT